MNDTDEAVMPNALRFDSAFAACPLVAILRGVQPDEAVAIGTALVEAGITLIEVPFNSPDAASSIARLVDSLGDKAVIGGGTVTQSAHIRALVAAGAVLAVSPHMDRRLIEEACDAGLVTLPGVLSPSEAFTALAAGAHGLKLFPMEIIGVKGMAALKAVLPANTRLVAVGGVTAQTIAEFRRHGAAGAGLGGWLYKPGDVADTVQARAIAAISAWLAAGA
jgi:2-dehydro-3-deoxyphosphogalactonate aldolase